MGKKCYRAFCALMSAVLLFSFLSMMAFALPPSGSELYRGIDVSEWQGAIDFSRVRQSGIQVSIFALVLAAIIQTLISAGL